MGSPRSIYYGIRNALLFYEEWNPTGVEETLRLVEHSLISKMARAGDRAALAAIFQAVEDFLLDRRGAREEGTRMEAPSERYTQRMALASLRRFADAFMANTRHDGVVKVYFEVVRGLVEQRIAGRHAGEGGHLEGETR